VVKIPNDLLLILVLEAIQFVKLQMPQASDSDAAGA
jgi:hypothetical protein